MKTIVKWNITYYIMFFNILLLLLFYRCDYNKYTLKVVRRIASLQINKCKEEVKTENELMEVDENNVISIQ